MTAGWDRGPDKWKERKKDTANSEKRSEDKTKRQALRRGKWMETSDLGAQTVSRGQRGRATREQGMAGAPQREVLASTPA